MFISQKKSTGGSDIDTMLDSVSPPVAHALLFSFDVLTLPCSECERVIAEEIRERLRQGEVPLHH